MKKNKCSTPYCRNKKAPGRSQCHRCRNKRYRQRNPFMYVFHTNKTNAKARGIEWAISFEEFKQWCIDNNYLTEKGRNSFSATIDRVRNHEGYHINNIQKLTLSENVRKMHVDFYNNGRSKNVWFNE